MLGKLTEKMQSLFASIAGKKKLTEENIADATRDVRLALLEADVHFEVVKTFIKRVKEKALGDAVMKSVTPGQQFIKIVHEELIDLMGKEESSLHLDKKPSVVMLCGLQGSGKTTQCVKLAHYLLKNKLAKKILIAACDLQRPAAINQLEILGREIEVPVFILPNVLDPLKVAREALQKAKDESFDLLIVDTAGRLHIDEPLMQELKALQALLKPQEILFVANAATGQDAVNSASQFNKELAITGSILTMLDGDTRGGAALSIREVTGKPLTFEGIGEKIDDLQLFNPTSMADRILGMGDTINLVKRAKEHVNEEEAKNLADKMRSASFTYNDYLSQIQTFKKIGSFKNLIKMLPGASHINFDHIDEKELFSVEAIIQSMTPAERLGECELIPSRRKRIAKGSGNDIEEINRLVKSFKQAKQFFKNMPNFKQMEKLMGGMPWR